MRRSGSAAPHSSWSPTVNADRYSPPIASLRSRPIGTDSLGALGAVIVVIAGATRSLPLVFVGLVFQWLKDQGGLAVMAERNRNHNSRLRQREVREPAHHDFDQRDQMRRVPEM